MRMNAAPNLRPAPARRLPLACSTSGLCGPAGQAAEGRVYRALLLRDSEPLERSITCEDRMKRTAKGAMGGAMLAWMVGGCSGGGLGPSIGGAGAAGSGGTAAMGGEGGAGTGGSMATACSSNVDCQPLGQLCDLVRGRCAACRTTADCGTDQECTDGACLSFTPCADSTRCPGLAPQPPDDCRTIKSVAADALPLAQLRLEFLK